MAKALRKVDHLIEKVGVGIVQTVESKYQKYLTEPSNKNAREYVLWRLRLHRRLKNDRDTLDAINQARNLGLYDENPGKLCWDCTF
jgi:predicted HTH transcriptional regulator